MMQIVLVEPGKIARPMEIKGELHEMQQIVGGTIQALYPWTDPVALICNDEGKLDGLPLNRVLENYDIIAGTFFICGIQGENFSGLTEKPGSKIPADVPMPGEIYRNTQWASVPPNRAGGDTKREKQEATPL